MTDKTKIFVSMSDPHVAWWVWPYGYSFLFLAGLYARAFAWTMTDPTAFLDRCFDHITNVYCRAVTVRFRTEIIEETGQQVSSR